MEREQKRARVGEQSTHITTQINLITELMLGFMSGQLLVTHHPSAALLDIQVKRWVRNSFFFFYKAYKTAHRSIFLTKLFAAFISCLPGSRACSPTHDTHSIKSHLWDFAEVYKINVVLSLRSHHSELLKTFLRILNDYVHFHEMQKYFPRFLLNDFRFAFDPKGKKNDGRAVKILY